MAVITSSYQRAGGAAVQRNADVLPLPFLARPQAMTVYVRFVEMGNIIAKLGAKVVHIGSSNNTETPRFQIQDNANGFYMTRHDNGNTQQTSTLSTAPSIGDIVELVGLLNQDGSIKIIQSINGAAETTSAVTAAVALGPQWAASLLWFNGVGTNFIGFVGLRELTIHRGVQTLATMRRLAGVV